ncbi:MAG: hypothetical protein Q9209_003287 [Squamulea sp. 1 TL-2023]
MGLGYSKPSTAFSAVHSRREVGHTSPPNKARGRDEVAILPGVESLLKRKTFSKDEIASAFGKQMIPTEGNRLLHLVQAQRLAGTIDEETPAPPGQKQRALAWLRKHYPVDEERAIINRLEREEQTALRPPRKLGDSVYGDPVIDQIKRRNLARQAQKDAERAKAEAEAKSDLPVSTSKAVAEREERLSLNKAWVERYKKKAEETGLNSVPQMSFIRRVGPATLMTIAVVSLCIMFAQNYLPPPRAARILPNISMAAATVGALIGINATVWLAWRYPPFWGLMNRFFMLVPAYPYSSSMVANLFSHQMLYHLASNMAVLWFIGTKLHEDIGRGPFLALYLACGVTASHVLLLYTVLRKNWSLTSLGCSGALSAVLATWLCINSERGIRIWPLPPAATEAVQPLFLLALFIAVDIMGLRRGLRLSKYMPANDNRIDHVSHLAGYGCGIVAAQFLKPEARNRQQKESGKRASELEKGNNKVVGPSQE